MTNKKKSRTKENKTQIKNNTNILTKIETISFRLKIIIALILIVVPALIVTAPYVFDNLAPVGEDTVAASGKSHLYLSLEKIENEKALWNPAIFGGMPIYHRITPFLIQVDSLISVLSKFSYWSFWYLFIGGIGIFVLLIYKKIPWYLALLPAIVFVLLPDWQALIGSGHNAKLRAIMVFPWLLVSFNYFFDKKSWVGTGLFALAFAWMVRTQHIQIIFYGILILLFLFTVPFIRFFIKKDFNSVKSLSVKFILAIILTILMAAQPFFSLKEYAPYSTRGGKPVHINTIENSAEKSGGVSFDYATNWSLGSGEIIDFFIPRFHGGYSAEVYNGDKYSQVKGQIVPGYWGEKIFNGNYSFFGFVLFLFAIYGTYFYRKDKFVKALAVFAVFSVLLALGKHFAPLYKLFFYYVPYFSKFRAPAMFTNITFIALLTLAGYGLKALFTEDIKNDIKNITIIFGGGFSFLILIYLFKDSFAFMIPAEANRYNSQTLEIIKGIRKEFLTTDLIRIILLTAVLLTQVYLLIKQKASKILILLIISTLVIFETGVVTKLSYDKIKKNNREILETSVFKENEISRFLQKNSFEHRGIYLGKEFTSNHYAYFYPMISGYSAIKLQGIQDLVENNLFNYPTENKINWPIINMLSGKFVITNKPLQNDFLTLVAHNKNRKEFLYTNSRALPKAWFIKEVKSFPNKVEMLRFMNSQEFNPRNNCLILTSDLNNLNSKYTSAGDIKLLKQGLNNLSFTVEAKGKQFLIVSEIYYPEGWKALVDGKENKIYNVNHVLRGIEVPNGKHKIEFKFEPSTYFIGVKLAWVGNILVLALITFGLFSERRKNGGETLL